MKFRVLIIGLLAGLIGLPVGVFGQIFQPIEYQNALLLAAENQQLIWLNFNSPADELCVQMDESVFSDLQIQTVSRSFIRVRLDANSASGSGLMAKYRLAELPASLFVNSAGEEVERITGYLAAPFFLQKIKKIRSGVDTFAALEKKYERDPMNGDLAFQLAKKRVLMGQKMAASELFENVLTLDSENDCGCLAEVYFNLGTLAIALDDPELAEYYWTILAQDFPDSKFTDHVLKKMRVIENHAEQKGPVAEPVAAFSEDPENQPKTDSLTISTAIPVDSLAVIMSAEPGPEILAEAVTDTVVMDKNTLTATDTTATAPNDSTIAEKQDFATVYVSFELDSTVLDFESEVAVIWQDSMDVDSAKAAFPAVTVIGVDTSMWADSTVDWNIEPENTAAADSFDYYLARASVFLNSSRSQQGLRLMVRAYQLAPNNVANLKRMAEMAMVFEIHGNAPVYWAAQAVELTEHKVADLLHVLAEMYAMNSLYTAAIEVEREALDVAADSDPKRLYAKRIHEWQDLEKETATKEEKK